MALDGRGVLFLGRSGRGKSALALDLLARGADLVADDATRVTAAHGRVLAEPAGPVRGMIEARGIGILRASQARDAVPVALLVDLDRAEPARLPPWRARGLLGVAVPLILGRGMTHLAPAVLLWLRHGRAM